MQTPKQTTRHTREPWIVGDDGTSFRSETSTYVGFTALQKGTPDPLEAAKNNARHVVACVNALAGYNPTAVRELVEAAEGMLSDHQKLDPEPRTRIILNSHITRLRAALAAVKGEK